jgi:hypothetical protein
VGSAASQALLAPTPTTETRSPILKYSKSVAVYHLDFQILGFHTTSARSSRSPDKKNPALGRAFSPLCIEDLFSPSVGI